MAMALLYKVGILVEQKEEKKIKNKNYTPSGKKKKTIVIKSHQSAQCTADLLKLDTTVITEVSTLQVQKPER